MNKTNLVLGIALGISIMFNVFSNEVKALINIMSLIVFAAVVATVVLAVSESIERFWINVGRTIGRFQHLIQILIAWTVPFYEMPRSMKEWWDRSLQLAWDASEALRSHSEEAPRRFRDFVVSLVVGAERMIEAGWNFLMDKFRAFVSRMRSTFLKNDDPPVDPPTKELCKRAVIIVSLPYGKSFEAIKKVVGEQNPSRPSINWDSNDKTLFPPIQKLPSFIRHFAVCLIPLDVWDDPTKSLIQRFQNGTYWELIGPDPVPREGDCVGWTEEKIRHIDAIEDIGVTAFGNFVVSEDVYRPLRAAWTEYDAVSWNCFDFTIRLAFLTLCDDKAKLKLRLIRETIEGVRFKALFFAVQSSFVLRFLAAIWLSIVSSLLPGVLTASLILWSVGMASPWWREALSMLGIDWELSEFMRKWRERSKTLERMFPQLEGLIEWPPKEKG